MKPDIKTFNEKAVPQLKPNEKVEVLQKCTDEDNKEFVVVIFEGAVKFINSKHFTLVNKNKRTQCFMYSDFIENRFNLRVIT